MRRARRDVAGALLGALCLAACGKKGDPLPPVRRDPKPVTDLKLIQREEAVILSFLAARQTLEGEPLDVHEVELLVTDQTGDIKTVARPERVRVAPGERFVRTLALPAPGTVLRAAARSRFKGGSSTLTAPAQLTVGPPSPPPQGVTAENAATGVLVRFTAPASPPAPTGYRLYRRPAEGVYPEEPTASAGTGVAEILDVSAQAGERWCYVVRSVQSTTPLIESGNSNEACLDVADRKAPDPPTGVAVLPRDGHPEVSWSPSGEADLRSYRVRRATSGSEPAEIGTVTAPDRTYTDREAPAGATLAYTVTATDAAGNESAPSEAATITLPEVP